MFLFLPRNSGPKTKQSQVKDALQLPKKIIFQLTTMALFMKFFYVLSS